MHEEKAYVNVFNAWNESIKTRQSLCSVGVYRIIFVECDRRVFRQIVNQAKTENGISIQPKQRYFDNFPRFFSSLFPCGLAKDCNENLYNYWDIKLIAFRERWLRHLRAGDIILHVSEGSSI